MKIRGRCLHVVTLCMVLAGCELSPPPQPLPDDLEIEVTGADFEWHVRYAGLDQKLGTDDDRFSIRNVTVLANRPTKIHLKSTDYIYSFALPHWGLKEIAVPDLEFSLQFTPQQTGTFELKGDQLCGFRHRKLIGKLTVLSDREFRDWLNESSKKINH